ncbi:MAG TPA: toll/interleukin-1 receptor domain-containing protein [Sphingomicrobium sp.]|jgi:tetratricopeptide (TPR) repeat protein
MAKLARLTAIGRSAEAEHARMPRLRTRYYAFLSYSHKDSELADWLHRELERFRVPHSLAGKLTANGVVPRRLTPIFRDQHDLSAGGDLAEEIKAALAASQFLVVLCSPTAAKSRWTNQEIESFKRTRPEGCVLAAVASGEPFATDLPGHEDEECFPPALRYKYDRRGHQTAKRAEPLAADFREEGDGRRIAFLKLVAGMLGVGLDELVRREQTRRQRRLAYLAAASIAGMAVTSTLAVAALQARNEARDQRREAEGLVAFMLGDLKDKLEPIGRLDALDGVGSRVLAYYRKQDASQLTDAALSQRSQALTLMAQVANARGDTQTSLKLYSEAMAGTAEAMRRKPDDPQAIFEHAQNVFYVGEIAQNDGDLRKAEASMREYQRLARQMVALQPDSMKYRMEVQYADADLGIVLYDQRRFPESVSQFSDALGTMDAILTADSSNKDYRQGVAESLAWLADAERAVGNYDRAIALRQRNVALYNQLLAQTGDVQYRQQLIPATRALGYLYAERGQQGLAADQFRASVAQSDMLTAVEPSNTLWAQYGYRDRMALARLLIITGKHDEAAEQISAACQTVGNLMKRPSIKPEWRSGVSSCLRLRAQLALTGGNKDQALSFATQAVPIAATVHTADKPADAFQVARAYRLIGDIQRDRGEMAAAQSAWSAALAVIPKNVPEMPDEIAEHATILRRLGQQLKAQSFAAKLNGMGYRQTE